MRIENVVDVGSTGAGGITVGYYHYGQISIRAHVIKQHGCENGLMPRLMVLTRGDVAAGLMSSLSTEITVKIDVVEDLPHTRCSKAGQPPNH